MVLGNNVNVGIGTSTPAPTSLLELSSNSKGLLIPRMSTDERNLISSPATGLLVYDNSLNSFYYHNGSAWTEVGASASANAWSLTGNAGTDPTNNFIGTTDGQPLLFKVSNFPAGRIHPTGDNTAFGLSALNITPPDLEIPHMAVLLFLLTLPAPAIRQMGLVPFIPILQATTTLLLVMVHFKAILQDQQHRHW
jgi:hypothetical protein